MMTHIVYILEFTEYQLTNLLYLFTDFYFYYATTNTVTKQNLYFSYPVSSTLIFTLKLVLGICFLIVIRGGVPRYRYDFLTKMGWVKFLTYMVTLFFITLSLNLLI